MARIKKTFEDKEHSVFGNRLRSLMKDHKVTQEDLAGVINRKRQTVAQYVGGISEPPYPVLVEIAKYFNTTTDYLVGRTNDSTLAPSAVDDLGLSECAVAFLKYCNNSQIKKRRDHLHIINAMFSMEDFENLLIHLEDYIALRYADDIYDTVFRTFFPGGERAASEMCEYNCLNPDNKDTRLNDFTVAIMELCDTHKYDDIVNEYLHRKFLPSNYDVAWDLNPAEIFDFTTAKLFGSIINRLTDNSVCGLGKKLYYNGETSEQEDNEE